jgi:hypothetical protein
MESNVRTYHRTLFQWHCRHFFNFRRRLSSLEKVYLETCFALPQALSEVSDGGYAHFSYYTYSHRVKGSSVNSSRIAYGSVSHPDEAWQAARPVVEQRGVVLPAGLAEENPFYGLGWDVEEGLFKVYFRTLDWRRLPLELADLVVDYSWNDHRPEGLLSLTYTGSRLVERKVYLYPKESTATAGVQGQARMITDTRGEVIQDDLVPDGVIPYELNDTGKRILAMYEKIGEPLDTIAYKDSEDFTLYFP